MREFIITERGYTVDGVEVPVGERVKFEELPVFLVGKAVEAEDRALEVSTPKRSRKDA